MLERISHSTTLDKIIIATTTEKIDDKIEELSKKLDFFCVRGSEEDVLSRFNLASEKSNADIIVRLCGDSPLLDGEIIDKSVVTFLENKFDYVNNLLPLPKTYPDGLSVEVFSSKLLKDMHFNAKKPSEREHVTQYIWNNFEKYNIHRIDYEKNFSNLRFNLDYIEDYEFINKIFELLYDTKKYFLLKDIIGLLEMKKEIIRINQHIIPNLGLKKSIERDKLLGFK